MANQQENDDEQRILRDYLAYDRTRLANERTLLAYTRTGLAFLITAASLFQFFTDQMWAHILGYVFLAIGGLCFIVGIASFTQMHRRYHQEMTGRTPTTVRQQRPQDQ